MEEKIINYPKVSIIIPSRNEEKFIESCLKSLLENDYPKDKLEIIVVDAMSEDNTREIVRRFENVKILNNPHVFTSYALNLGIKKSSGKIIMLASAHTEYSSNYIKSCVKRILEGKCEIAGGILRVISRKNSAKAKAIARVLSHPFGIGGAKYRIGIDKEIYVDTVAYGLYEKKLFDKVGYFNEKLIRNQDIEMNLRLKRIGARIMLVPEAVSYYYARDTIRDLLRNNFGNGFWVIYGLKYANLPFSLRHLIPLFFLLFIFSSILFFKILPWIFLPVYILYLILDLVSSIHIGLKEKSLLVSFWGFIVFPLLHLVYGLGSLFGFFKLIFSKGE